jgi:WD40 repeat protein
VESGKCLGNAMAIHVKFIALLLLMLFPFRAFAQDDGMYEIITPENVSRLEPIKQWNWLGETGRADRSTGAFSPDGEWLVINQGDEAIRFLKIGTWEEEFALSTGGIKGQDIIFSNNGNRLLYIDILCGFIVWSIAPNELIRLEEFDCETYTNSFMTSDDLATYYVFDENTSKVAIVDMHTGEERLSLSTIVDSWVLLPGNFSMSNDGKRVALTDENLNIEVWDTQTQERISYFVKENAATEITGLGFSTDSNQIWTNYSYYWESENDVDDSIVEAKIEFWDIHTLERTMVLEENIGLGAVGFYPNNNFAYISGLRLQSPSHVVLIKDLDSLEVLAETSNRSFSLNPMNEMVVQYSPNEETIRIFPIDDVTEITYLDTLLTTEVQFSPDGKYMFTNGNILQIWAAPKLEDADS